jgi:adenylate kinase
MIWHVEFDAPMRDGVCDRCGDLFQRKDDSAEAIAEQLTAYARFTAQLVFAIPSRPSDRL